MPPLGPDTPHQRPQRLQVPLSARGPLKVQVDPEAEVDEGAGDGDVLKQRREVIARGHTRGWGEELRLGLLVEDNAPPRPLRAEAALVRNVEGDRLEAAGGGQVVKGRVALADSLQLLGLVPPHVPAALEVPCHHREQCLGHVPDQRVSGHGEDDVVLLQQVVGLLCMCMCVGGEGVRNTPDGIGRLTGVQWMITINPDQ